MSDKLVKAANAPSREEQKKQYELRMKKQRRRETITVLAILSSVFIVAILLALLKGGERMVQDITGGSMAQAREIYKNTKSALIGMGIISSIIMVIFLIQTIRDRRKRKLKEMAKEPFIDYDRLEMAKIRVEKAHMDAKKNKSLSSRSNDRSIRLRAMEKEDNEYLFGHRGNQYEGMSEEEYRRYRQEEYERYMSMDMNEEEEKWPDDMDENGESEYKQDGLLNLVKKFFIDHKVLIGVATGVLLLAVIVLILL